MASRFYGVAAGGKMPGDVTEAGATNATAIELQVDLSKVTDLMQVRLAVEAILHYLETKEGNPIG